MAEITNSITAINKNPIGLAGCSLMITSNKTLSPFTIFYNLMRTTLSSEQATIQAGIDFAKNLKGGNVVLLYGELGAGKTTFVKGIARRLGIKEDITSPTFTLMSVYKVGARQLCHIDTYRLKNVNELRAIGVEDYIGDKNTITIIEWPEKITTLLKKVKTKKVRFTHTKTGRNITF